MIPAFHLYFDCRFHFILHIIEYTEYDDTFIIYKCSILPPAIFDAQPFADGAHLLAPPATPRLKVLRRQNIMA